MKNNSPRKSIHSPFHELQAIFALNQTTQESVALDIAKTSTSTMSRYMHADAPFPYKVIEAIRQEFEIPPEDVHRLFIKPYLAAQKSKLRKSKKP